ncbi:MAG: hypothetical protein L0Y56_09935, partial [Nitrospira sp.]|nr:hypothetical protein [Nitrospira sp.]
MARDNLNNQLAAMMGGFFSDPLGYVMAAFPWQTEPSIQVVKLPEEYKKRFPQCEFGPDRWACEFLDQLGAEIKKRGFNRTGAVDPIRFSTASGHGIGKSTLVSWLVKFILDTRPDSNGIITATTSEQLKTKTWAEVGKWNALSLTRNLWDYSASRGAMTLKRRDY